MFFFFKGNIHPLHSNAFLSLPVWMYVCFFMSLFWWNRLPQYEQGYGRVSLCMRRCVDRVLDRLNAFPHCLHSNTFSTLWTALNEEQNQIIHINTTHCNWEDLLWQLPVLTEADLVAKGLIAQLAGKGSLAVMGAAGVYLEAVSGGKVLLALYTWKDITDQWGHQTLSHQHFVVVMVVVVMQMLLLMST